MDQNIPPNYIILGQLQRLYLIPPNNRPRINEPGGNVLYTASGLSIWEKGIGLIARVGEDYPHAWIRMFQEKGFDTRGIYIAPEAVDVRSFIAYNGLKNRYFDNPISHFARLEIPFPKALIGYRDESKSLDSRTQLGKYSIRQTYIPPDFLHATAAHFAPIDYLTHSFLPALLRQSGFTTLTLTPGPGYMDPTFWDLVPSIVTGLTAFLPTENQLRSLFYGRSADLNEMVETLAAYGCEIIVVKRGLEGQHLYDAEKKTHWEIPAYSSRDLDPTGAGAAFDGGFLAGYRKTFSPLEAVFHGNISASLSIEGSSPFYAIDATPGLASARLEAIRSTARKI